MRISRSFGKCLFFAECWFLLIFITGSELLGGEAREYESGESVSWHVISQGGGDGNSANYGVRYTIGQTAIGTGSSAGIVARNGFWQSLSGMCCVGRVGNANGVGKYPHEVTISDIQTLVTAKFIQGTCTGYVQCLAEGDVNQSGGTDPTCNDITISDIQTLVNHLFIAGPQNAPLKECL